MALAEYEGDVEAFGMDSSKGDERLNVRFFNKAARDDGESEKQGRMVFKQVEFIQIMVPGDRDHIIIRPAGDGDKKRFASHYEKWKKGEAEQTVGTPLELWGRLTLPQVEELRYIGVRTVEQLAVLNDAAMLKMPGCVEMKKKANAFLEAQKAEAPRAEMLAALEQRDTKLNEQANQIAELTRMVEALRLAQAAPTPGAKAARA